jgi:DNA-binding LacI/PurR family transcriptional regulator
MKGIQQLARHLGLTVGTVSRALNNRPEVNEKTRRRVFEAALEIGYVPNQSGRSLRTGATNTVGFMIESGTANAVGGDNFFMGVVGGVQQVLARRGLDLILLPCGAGEDPHEFLRRMVLRRLVDGMIISATQRHDPRIELMVKSKLPFVALGRSATALEHAWIDLDFFGVAGDAFDRLVARGHRRIAIALPDSEVNLGYVFREGYADALVRHGIAFDPELVVSVELSEAGGVDLADRLLTLRPAPTAVLLINELLAIGLYHRFGQVGIRPGRDIAVIGFRENPQIRFLSPRLTCYRLSLTDLGMSLGETLLARMPSFAAEFQADESRRIWPLEYSGGESDRMEGAEQNPAAG